MNQSHAIRVAAALLAGALMSSGCADETGADGPSEVGDDHTAESAIEVLLDREVVLTAGRSGPVTFTVPSDAVGVTVVVSGQPEETYAIESWRQPGSELVLEGWAERSLELCVDCPNRVLSNWGAVAAFAPNNPGVTLSPGEHSLEVVGFLDDIAPEPSEATVRLEVVAKVSPSPPEAGRLDLNLHFTGAAGLDAETAKTDPELQAALDELATIYAGADLTIGELRYLDVDPGFQVLSDFFPPSDMLQLLATEHEGAAPGAVNIFFVGEIGDGSLGKATVPGPTRSGTAQSGVIIALEPSGVDLSWVLAHEIGHHLGLWHTLDPIGEQVFSDQLLDTGDYDHNLMSSEHPSGAITAQQRRVILSNPLVRSAAR